MDDWGWKVFVVSLVVVLGWWVAHCIHNLELRVKALEDRVAELDVTVVETHSPEVFGQVQSVLQSLQFLIVKYERKLRGPEDTNGSTE